MERERDDSANDGYFRERPSCDGRIRPAGPYNGEKSRGLEDAKKKLKLKWWGLEELG